jgi:TonB family protein
MRHNDTTERIRSRNPERLDDESGVALPKRLPGTLFQGWGPKLMVAALAIGTLALSNKPANAATAVAMTACENHGATLISSPSFDVPDGVAERGDAILRIDLSATGRIENLAVAQSSGDPLLDFEAMRVARESRYNAAIVDCKPAADSVLYRVTFAG